MTQVSPLQRSKAGRIAVLAERIHILAQRAGKETRFLRHKRDALADVLNRDFGDVKLAGSGQPLEDFRARQSNASSPRPPECCRS